MHVEVFGDEIIVMSVIRRQEFRKEEKNGKTLIIV